MPEIVSQDRPSLPASTSAFDLRPSSRSASSDELNPFMLHLQRPSGSLLHPKLHHLSSEKRHRSPLSSSFTRRRMSNSNGEESESDRDSRMWTSDRSGSSSSGNATPPMRELNGNGDGDSQMKLPSTPPRNHSAPPNLDLMEQLPSKRRLSIPPIPPRILSLLQESRPEECELKSEAQFQRLVASYSENPLLPKTPSAPFDRGRYPEEAGEEEFQKEDTPSDDGEHHGAQDLIISSGRGTPARSINGDDLMPGSPGYAAMDVDSIFSFGSPGLSSTQVGSWRYTPPPTSSAVRSNKRKHDDRYDPYPASKRRAVSPSVSFLKGSPRISIPIAIPIAIPPSNTSSACSSPIITQLPSHYQANFSMSRPAIGSPMSSSPTTRTAIGLAASPVLRPLARVRREGEERGVDSAGDGVSGLNLE